MATDHRLLRNVIARLVRLGKSTREIFTRVKADHKFRRTPNNTIQTLMDEMRLAHNRGRAANKLGPSDKIGDVFKKDKKARPRRICIDYEFKHSAKGKSMRGSQQGASEISSIEVEASLSVKEVKDLIMGSIRTWLDRYYETSNIRSIRSSLSITTIQEC